MIVVGIFLFCYTSLCFIIKYAMFFVLVIGAKSISQKQKTRTSKEEIKINYFNQWLKEK